MTARGCDVKDLVGRKSYFVTVRGVEDVAPYKRIIYFIRMGDHNVCFCKLAT